MSRLKGKVAFITGASQGLGAALAQRFAEEGAELLLLARSIDGLEKIDDVVRKCGSRATLIPYDLNSWTGLEQLARPILDQFGRLDIFVANAAQLGTLTPIAHGTPEEWERLYRVNVLANWQLLRAFDPLLRAAPAGRVIGVTHKSATPLSYWGGYFSSKAAFDHLFLTYAQEIHQTRVHVNLVDPGPMRTQLRRQAFPGESSDSLPAPADCTDIFVTLCEEACQRHGEVIELASRQIHVA